VKPFLLARQSVSYVLCDPSRALADTVKTRLEEQEFERSRLTQKLCTACIVNLLAFDHEGHILRSVCITLVQSHEPHDHILLS
jgi:hypothetical protein